MRETQKRMVLMDCKIMLKNLAIFLLIYRMKKFKMSFGILEISMDYQGQMFL